MPYNDQGQYTPPDGAENAFPGKLIESAVWNAIFTDIAEALTLVGQLSVNNAPVIKTTAGPFTITDETYIVLNKGAPSATTINLPLASARSGQSLRVLDWAGNAGDITISPHVGDTIEAQSSWIISSGGAGLGGKITLYPVPDLNGWLVLY